MYQVTGYLPNNQKVVAYSGTQEDCNAFIALGLPVVTMLTNVQVEEV